MKIFSKYEVIDIVRFSENSAILVEKIPFIGNFSKYKVNYSIYNFETDEVERVTKGAYLLKKFGTSYKEISEKISDFVSCNAAILYDRRVLMIYPNGEAGIFDREGELVWSGALSYHDEVVRELALEGKYFWTICPKENCIIRYSSQNMKIDLRIGGKDATTFLNPTNVSVENGNIYVCCDSNRVKVVDKTNFSVSDFLECKEPIKSFQKIGDSGILCLDSGTYIL